MGRRHVTKSGCLHSGMVTPNTPIIPSSRGEGCTADDLREFPPGLATQRQKLGVLKPVGLWEKSSKHKNLEALKLPFFFGGLL